LYLKLFVISLEIVLMHQLCGRPCMQKTIYVLVHL